MPKRTAKSCLPSRDATVWAKRWAHLAALELPEYEDLTCPTVNDGYTLTTQPPTPAVPNHLTHDALFASHLFEKLERLKSELNTRAECYGMEISEWLPGHEPPSLKRRLLQEQELRDNEEARRINDMSDTDNEQEQQRKYRRRLKDVQKKSTGTFQQKKIGRTRGSQKQILADLDTNTEPSLPRQKRSKVS